MKFHEFKADGSTLAVRTINRYADEIGKESMDYEVFKTAAEMLDKQMLKSLAQLLDDSDTAPREWVMKTIADHDPDTFKKMYGDQEGYLSVMKPDQNLKDDNTDTAWNKYGLTASHKDGKFHSYRHGKLTGSFDSAEELAKHQKELIQNEDDGDERAIAAMKLDRDEKVDYANMMFHGKEIDHNSIDYEMQDYGDMIFELHGAKYIDGTPLTDEELEEFEKTGELIDWVSMDYVSESEVEEDGMTSADVDRVRNQNFTTNQIKHAYRVLNHPSVKGGNMTAAYNIINRIAPGLADHPDVANALKRANEGFIGKKTEYNDFLQNKLDTAIQEYDTPEKKAERDALMQKYLNKGGKIEKVPTGKTAYKGKELKPAYKKDTAGTPITSPMSDESVEEDINEKGRVVLEKAGFDPNAIHEYMAVFNDHGDTTDLEDMNRNKIGVADAMAMVLASHDVQNESVEESSIKPYVSMYKGDDGKTVYDVLDKDGKSAYKTKDERLAQHYFKKNYQKLKEDGPPFGSGMELLRMAIMRKFITVQEWDLLKHKWNDAADEVEQKYADWPEGEGFGSSDHNFAIRDLMSAVGYEFDDQDTSGRFVVIKQPEEIEKAGIRNARMKGEPVKAEGGMPSSIIKHKQKLAHMSDEELADRFKDFDEQRLRQMAWRHGYGKMSSHYLDRVRNHMTSKRTGTYESKLTTMLNQRLK